MDSPMRRVLGNKSTNASIRPSSPANAWKNSTTSHDHPSRCFDECTRSPQSSKLSKSPRVGQKRRIEEVERHDRHDSQQSADTNRLSQDTDLLSNDSSEMEDILVESTENTKSTAHTSLTSFQASQNEPEPVEVEFQIPDEMSQRALDKMHEIALPQNTSQPLSLLRPNLLKENSQISISLSSLIDFDQDKSSQHSDRLQMIEVLEKETAAAATRITKTEEENRRDMLSEKAETLRTRLQLALYKVKTNQTSKPFSRLTLPRQGSPELPPQPASLSPFPSPPRCGRFSSMSPESKIAIARARATMQVKKRVKPLEDVAHPTIAPAAFSARCVENEVTAVKVVDIPSSPPLSNGAEVPRLVKSGTPTPESDTKTGDATELPKTPMQLSSPPGSPEVKFSTAAKRLKGSKYEGLTSSVVKGEAASGLLELMRRGNGTAHEDEILE